MKMIFAIILFVVLLGASCPAGNENDFIPWQKLKNPFYSRPGWSTKDACMYYKDGTFYLFFSAFYYDRGRERSHVVGVKTKDFLSFSDLLFNWDGRTEGWIGMCSPNITRVGDTYYLTYNSWGDKKGKVNQLFYAESKDLEHWRHDIPLGRNVTVDQNGRPKRGIDAAIVFTNDKFYLVWKEGRPHRARIAVAKNLDGPFEYIGDGYPRLLGQADKTLNDHHENFQFLHIDDQWMLISTDYQPHGLYLYYMKENGIQDEHWLTWTNGRKLKMPAERFNTNNDSNAAFIADWRKYDGYFYCLYAGRTEGESHARRGDNRLGLARSRDLYEWMVP